MLTSDAPFCSQIFQIFLASGGKGALNPRNQNPADVAMGMCPSVSVRLSQVGVLSKWLNESSWVFFASELPSTRPTLC